jgi:hypothetical protein
MEFNPLIRLYGDVKTVSVTYYYDLEIITPSGEFQNLAGRNMYTLVNDHERQKMFISFLKLFKFNVGNIYGQKEICL